MTAKRMTASNWPKGNSKNGRRDASVFVGPLDEITLLAAIANLNDCVEAEKLLVGVRRLCSSKVYLMLERRYGELAESAGTGWGSRRSRNARLVAAVDQKTFDEYLATASKPSRQGLLDYAQPAEERDQEERQAKEQLEWLASDAGRRWVQGNLYEFDGKWTPSQAKKKTPHGSITDKGVVKAWDRLVDEVRADRNVRAKMAGRTGWKRLREAKSGERMSTVTELARMQLEIAQLCVVLQDFDVERYDLSDQPVLWRATDILDDLLLLGEWLDQTLTSIQARVSHQDVRDKIAKLRDTTGRTPEERETALRLADQLERKLKNRLTA